MTDRAPKRTFDSGAGLGRATAPLGLAAILDGGTVGADGLADAVSSMAEGLTGRAGGAVAVWADPQAGIALAQRQSGDAGRPDIAGDGRWRVALDGRPRFVEAPPGAGGLAPGERLAAALERWGLDETLKRLDGAFAALIWDAADRRLVLLADRAGQRPLYWGATGTGALVAASTLRAITAHPRFERRFDIETAASWLACGWTPAPRSLMADLRRLSPGEHVTAWLGPDARPRTDIGRWAAIGPDGTGADGPSGPDRLERALLAGLDAGLDGARAPGLLLSPAPQSMALAALLARTESRPVRALSFRFGDGRHDGGAQAEAIAAHLGIDNRVEELTPQALIDLAVDLPVLFDEPIADPAALIVLHAMRILRGGCDTVVTGAGADVALGIRPLYGEAFRNFAKANAIARALLPTAPFGWMNTISSRGKSLRLGDRWRNRLREGAAPSRRLWLEERRRLWRTVDRPAPEPSPGFTYPGRAPAPTGAGLADLALADLASEIPDNALVQIDRIAASQRLGVVAPFLDGQALSAALGLIGRDEAPTNGAEALGALLNRYLPRSVWGRPGAWPIPLIGDWLRGPLRGWCEEMLRSDLLGNENLLDPEPVRGAWEAHLRGFQDWGRELWAVALLSAWARRWRI